MLDVCFKYLNHIITINLNFISKNCYLTFQLISNLCSAFSKSAVVVFANIISVFLRLQSPFHFHKFYANTVQLLRIRTHLYAVLTSAAFLFQTGSGLLEACSSSMLLAASKYSGHDRTRVNMQSPVGSVGDLAAKTKENLTSQPKSSNRATATEHETVTRLIYILWRHQYPNHQNIGGKHEACYFQTGIELFGSWLNFRARHECA